MNTTEKNILIAEFLGFQKTDLGWYDFEETLVKFESDNTFDVLKFDTDWNWLIEVVREIYSFEIENELVLIVRDALADASIHGTYDACVEFINWHNKQNYESKENTQ